MTTEIVIMNGQGVALAADSAVTVGSSKIFNTANKLYMLAPDCPVGILIYNNASFMNLPWEIIIKAYKDHTIERNKKLDKLEQYAEDFVSFLKANHEKFSTKKQQELIIAELTENLFDEITQIIWKNLEKIAFTTSEKIGDSQVKDETNAAIEEVYKIMEQQKDIYSPDETAKLSDYIFENFTKDIEKARIQYFDKLPLGKDQIDKLNKMCVYLLIKDRILPIYSGIVFVGYGNEDLLPACCSYIFESLIAGILKYKEDEETSQKIEFTGQACAVMPFGQADIAHNFIFGAHPSMVNILTNKLLNNLKMSLEDANSFISEIFDEMFDGYTSSIYMTVRALPKEDLAIMAETLVNLTSFMRKVSMSLESVGGPVDVAVISKQDGFIWIKKKHYFDMQDNLHLPHTS